MDNSNQGDRVLLLLQQLLLGQITHSMRRVDVCFDDKRIHVRIATDMCPDDELIEIADQIQGDIEAQFLESPHGELAGAFKPSIDVSVVIQHIPGQNEVAEFWPFNGNYEVVFSRKEKLLGSMDLFEQDKEHDSQTTYWKNRNDATNPD
jgi:hypothetical protein